MKGLREPLLWIALASLWAFLPLPTVALPVSAALALGTLMLSGTRVARLAPRPLLLALFACSILCLLNAVCLFAQMAHSEAYWLWRAAELGTPLAFWALASALLRIADSAAIERSADWLFGVRILFLGWFCVDWFTRGAGFMIGFIACPVFALIVLRLRAEVAIPDAR